MLSKCIISLLSLNMISDEKYGLNRLYVRNRSRLFISVSSVSNPFVENIKLLNESVTKIINEDIHSKNSDFMRIRNVQCSTCEFVCILPPSIAGYFRVVLVFALEVPT